MSENSSGGILRVVARSPSAYTAGEPNGPNDTNGPDGNLNGRGWGVGWTRAGQIAGGVAGGVAGTVAVGGVAYLAKKAASAYLWPDHPRRAQVPTVRLKRDRDLCSTLDNAGSGEALTAGNAATKVGSLVSKICLRSTFEKNETLLVGAIVAKTRKFGSNTSKSNPRTDEAIALQFTHYYTVSSKKGNKIVVTTPTIPFYLRLCLSTRTTSGGDGAQMSQLDPEVAVTAMYAGFEYAHIGFLRTPNDAGGSGPFDDAATETNKSKYAAASRADRWDVTMCVCPRATNEYFARYQRAIAAASRVVVYRADQWVRSDGGKGASRDSLGQVAVDAARCAAVRTDAISLCAEFRAKSTQRVGIMVFSDGRPGGAVWDNLIGNVADGNNPLTTHESAVVGAWLRGECPAGPTGRAGAEVQDERESIRRHFQATIASRWSNGEHDTSSPHDHRYDRYGDVWVVRDAALDTTQYDHSHGVGDLVSAADVPKSTKATNVTNVTLVFVNVNAEAPTGGARLVELAVRAGLDAMIVEGVSVAIVAPDDFDGIGLVGIVDRALGERPNEPAASDESGQAFGMPAGGELRELGLKNESVVPEPTHEPAVPVATSFHTSLESQMLDQHANSSRGAWAYAEARLEPIRRRHGVTELDNVSSRTRGGYFSAVRIATLVNPAQIARPYKQKGYQQQGYPQQQYDPYQVFGSSARAGSRFV